MMKKNKVPENFESQVADLKDWHDQIIKSLVSDITCTYGENCEKRSGISLTLIYISLSHFYTILNLIVDSKHHISASALLRPQWECVARAQWIMESATAEEVSAIYDMLNNDGEIYDDHRIWPRRDVTRHRAYNMPDAEYSILCDPVHGGAMSVSRNIDKSNKTIGYYVSVPDVHKIICRSYETSFQVADFLIRDFFNNEIYELNRLASERKKIYRGDVA